MLRGAAWIHSHLSDTADIDIIARVTLGQSPVLIRENGVSARRLTASRRVKHEDHKTENVIS